jgi:hypothetical protein
MELSSELLSEPVAGRNLEGATLGDALGDDPVLLVFLRHLG